MALFLIGLVLFNFPVLAIFNVSATVAGVPVLYVYIFAAWGLLIALAAVVIDGGG
jgi:hypothetical protein